jgi:hypothetical protein
MVFRSNLLMTNEHSIFDSPDALFLTIMSHPPTKPTVLLRAEQWSLYPCLAVAIIWDEHRSAAKWVLVYTLSLCVLDAMYHRIQNRLIFTKTSFAAHKCSHVFKQTICSYIYCSGFLVLRHKWHVKRSMAQNMDELAAHQTLQLF